MNRRKQNARFSPVRDRAAEHGGDSHFAGSATSVVTSLAVCLAVALLLAAYQLGPLAVPAALAGAGVAAVHQRRRRQAARTARLAMWALHAPCGRADAQAVERFVAADIGAMSAMHAGAIARARAFVRRAAADRWRLELALERLARADSEYASGLGGLRCGRCWRLAPTRLGIPASVIVVLVSVSVPAPLSTAGVAAATAMAVASWSAMCDDWAYVPQQLASAALAPLSPTPSLLPEPFVVEMLAELARGEVAVVDEAVTLLKTARHPEVIDLALARMQAVRRVL